MNTKWNEIRKEKYLHVYFFDSKWKDDITVGFSVFELIEKYYYSNNRIFDIRIMIYLNKFIYKKNIILMKILNIIAFFNYL